MLGLPGPAPTTPVPEVVAQHLPKNVPLLVLASYLSGRHKREALVELLQGMHTGRHYYFTYAVPAEAPLGRYMLLSELYTDGRLQHSGTAAEDFFLVEDLHLSLAEATPAGGLRAVATNPGPEPVSIRVVEYQPERQPSTSSYVREVPAQGSLPIESSGSQCFVLYNEEREVLPVISTTEPVFLRNQQLLTLEKEVDGLATTYVLTGETDNAYELTGSSRDVWHLADGLHRRSELPDPEMQTAYQDLLDEGLIQELPH
ncbi:hypothetical protein [Hymenobacter cellulosilyticus]|uniref:Uncharacterized protein n=1 Tax=Hymenobacter cellulosilyticus TaxID=2932248 RepID=A0A8T9PZM0_9BACT|nr:hypothetical protein [Hymenobacter cellulosilyticus]UOQ70195.1 hypothetical protein MUN79_15670 [Hymenobacter cellulosilyticus]